MKFDIVLEILKTKFWIFVIVIIIVFTCIFVAWKYQKTTSLHKKEENNNLQIDSTLKAKVVKGIEKIEINKNFTIYTCLNSKYSDPIEIFYSYTFVEYGNTYKVLINPKGGISYINLTLDSLTVQ